MTLAFINTLPLALCFGAVGIVFYGWCLAKVSKDSDRDGRELLAENWSWPER